MKWPHTSNPNQLRTSLGIRTLAEELETWSLLEDELQPAVELEPEDPSDELEQPAPELPLPLRAFK